MYPAFDLLKPLVLFIFLCLSFDMLIVSRPKIAWLTSISMKLSIDPAYINMTCNR